MELAEGVCIDSIHENSAWQYAFYPLHDAPTVNAGSASLLVSHFKMGFIASIFTYVRLLHRKPSLLNEEENMKGKGIQR